ncbi:hypothetical protein QQ991_17050 [Weizmannia coagulans]|jgi:hypothetical protein|uniref:Uncharacterized protein n=3 Tax=Heyndrickxia TaxID=2837504 RepID=A0A0C5CK27_HEYCO|nr:MULTISPECIES: hypothetical protein [Heyndrickxia]AEP01263.1 hypothetical protein Bcoa_2079 [Heyndrickxia coagulans 36D1]AJO21722.1 hypothetical protein SB48_HM08orf01426 [Heyndrickxia coagulans]APB37091.1 hypothetical protein BIZ35_09995 [Heyndrickxia coagulans]ATW82217.1 hypothetical protein CIW84_03935 [Heyndrickxia coagulans]AVD57120.1 hypothetical protein C3766_14025 [Heyndrickxia coagulans]
MKPVHKKIIGVVVGLLLIVGALALLNGWFSGSEDTHPPCNQLPTVSKVDEAIASHQKLTKEIKSIGDDITVEVGRPCSKDQNRGLVMVKYGTKTERKAIDDLLSRRNGFGVPVYLVKN